jgi:predicted deacetylase
LRAALNEKCVVTGAAAPALPLFGVAQMQRTPLVVSLHDVAPPTRVASEKIVRELAHHGVRVSSILVVPDYHHTGRAMENRDFVQWLRDLESAGHEIVLHGYFHQRQRRPNESLRAKVITRSYTSDEGEFYDLDYKQALERITRGRDEFVRAGLRPRGFIAPAWLLSPEGERAARDAEMEYTTRLTSVHDLRTGHCERARSLVYSVRNSWRRATSLAWNGTCARLLAETPLLRLSLHPPDFEHAEIWTQVTQLLDRFAETRTPTTYRDWIAEQRVNERDAA